jgi:hypothetical protein
MIGWMVSNLTAITPSSGKYAGSRFIVIGGEGNIVHLMQTNYADAFVGRDDEQPGGKLPSFRFDVDNSAQGDGIVRCARSSSFAPIPVELDHAIFNAVRADWNALVENITFYANPANEDQRLSNLSLYQTLCSREGLSPNVV